jgi:uncharacterized OB-fold protein
MNQMDFTRASFQKYLDQKKLMGARCQSCGNLFLPPRPLCTKCFSQELAWEELPGEGELAAFSIIHIAPTAMIAAGYGRENPYCSGIVKLKDGVSISAQILGVDVAHPENIAIGVPLRVEFIERQAGEEARTYLAFQKAD